MDITIAIVYEQDITRFIQATSSSKREIIQAKMTTVLGECGDGREMWAAGWHENTLAYPLENTR
jgi:hypothetical protein